MPFSSNEIDRFRSAFRARLIDVAELKRVNRSAADERSMASLTAGRINSSRYIAESTVEGQNLKQNSVMSYVKPKIFNVRGRQGRRRQGEGAKGDQQNQSKHL